MPEHSVAAPLALYIHWPFCLAKCPYCDFNSHVREHIDQSTYRAALLRELAWEAARLGPRRLTSIFFGGGTPSLMAPATVAALIEAACTHFDPAEDIEITLEANPTSVELARLSAFRQAGVNRLSLGVQALDDAALTALGRRHSAREAHAALELARGIFPRLSFDLIYARPGQTLPAWRAELRGALALAGDHLSLYQLTIEPGTAFEALHRAGTLVLPDDDNAAALYEATGEAAEAAGLAAYEISNYAAPGHQSRHNLAYWQYDDYAGVGPGAHGRVSVDGALLATRRHRVPEIWAERVAKQGHGSTHEDAVPPVERAREALIMGLRLSAGIDAAHFAQRTGMALDDAINQQILLAAIDANLLRRTPTHLIASGEGRLRLDALLSRLVK